MADYFVGPVLEKLIDACYEYLKHQFRYQTGVQEELQKLQFILPKIQAVVSAYSQADIEDPPLNNCLWQLRDAIDEADDVLDEFEYIKREEQACKNKKMRKTRFLMKVVKKRVVKIGKRALRVDPSLKKLEAAVQKLCNISAEVSSFQSVLDRANQEQQQRQLELHETREAGSMNRNEFFGRSEEKEFVRQWLRKSYQLPNSGDSTDSYRNVSLLSVVGHGGMGKTTLLQHAYEDEMMKGFDVKIWVCVSTNFKAKIVIANILKCLQKQVADEEQLESLQRSLQSEVKSKRFLLVLDDIWEDDEREWKKVLDPLSYGSSGSKILITTRMDSVASTFAKMIKKNKEVLRVNGLEEDECLLLLSTHAFAGVENPDDEFRSIVRKMVNKLSRCPLAAKVIGGILNLDVNKSYWTKILNTNIGNVGSHQNHLMPILKLSYRYLPKFLQNCFSFCSIFQQDHEFDKDDLVRMWIALGFIQSSNISGETLEDTGRRYFNILVQKSFFDEFRTHDDKICYKMHDLLHELAQSVSTRECFRSVDYKELPIPYETIRHLSIDAQSLKAALKKMGIFKNLRSLFLSFSNSSDENVISEILKTLKSIRLLVIIFPPSYNYKLPDTVGCLIHLRYLKVKCYVSLKLPRSTRHLYHLQFIISKKLQKLEMDNIGWKACNWLQGGIYNQNSRNLIHLTGRQELKINENCKLLTDELVIKDPYVLLMEPLRSTSSFRFLTIKKNNLLVTFPSETEQWFLQHSSSLFRLQFENLRSLQSLPSSLESLSSLETLCVYDVPQLKLLPNPPASLTTLTLSNLESLLFLPSSLSTISSLNTLRVYNVPQLKLLPNPPDYLVKLILVELESLQCLPSSLLAISSLRHLKLKNIPLLKSLPDLPPSLTKLKLIKLQNLDSLPSCLPTLNKLWIFELPRLLELPDLPSSLEDLEIAVLESLQCLPPSLSAISSLYFLELKNIPLLQSLPDLPSSLRYLELEKLESLQCLPSSLSAISSLKVLKLYNIPLLKSLPDLPSSLKEELKLGQLESLQRLPSSLSAISSLETLVLENIPLLKSLPDLPRSLRNLWLHELENLDCLPACLPTTLFELTIIKVSGLLELPDLPASLNVLSIRNCHPQLMQRYENFDRR